MTIMHWAIVLLSAGATMFAFSGVLYVLILLDESCD